MDIRSKLLTADASNSGHLRETVTGGKEKKLSAALKLYRQHRTAPLKAQPQRRQYKTVLLVLDQTIN